MRFHLGRKFLAFILCLASVTVLGLVNKGIEAFPYIVGLFAAYTAGNVTQKATQKEVNSATE